MGEQLYIGDGQRRSEPHLPPPLEPLMRSSEGYRPNQALKTAVDVALIIGQPLLVTGEPGTGKTTLARAVANELFAGRYLELQVKSTTRRSDLLYRINDLERFRDAQPQGKRRPLLEYMELQPLGEAILRACGPDAPLHDQAGRKLTGSERFLVDVFGPLTSEIAPVTRLLLSSAAEWIKPERWVVLIDEIDKAPRDTPNDLLEEFERMSFAIPELGLKVVPPDGAPRPVVIVTSNSEKSLPEAFLRRCAYHHIEFPGREELLQIIQKRVGSIVTNDTGPLERVLELFSQLRAGLQNPPSTSELLTVLRLLYPGQNSKTELDDDDLVKGVKRHIAIFAKQPQDQVSAATIIDNWSARK